MKYVIISIILISITSTYAQKDKEIGGMIFETGYGRRLNLQQTNVDELDGCSRDHSGPIPRIVCSDGIFIKDPSINGLQIIKAVEDSTKSKVSPQGKTGIPQ